MKNSQLTRRSFMGWGLAGSLGLAGHKALGAVCGPLTPEQTEGPFYPRVDQADKNNDLTQVQGRREGALGEVVIVRGVVRDQDCRPVSGALVEIWQACQSGRYNHSSDPNPAPLDPNFQYWGQDVTNENGEYSFKTIVPGAYPAADQWMRPPHIHFKAHARGYFELTTQMYFAGHELNEADHILKSLPPQEQQAVVVEFTSDINDPAAPAVGKFDLVLRRVL